MAKKGKNDAQKYELMLILKTTLSDSQRKQGLTKITSFIKDGKGTIEHENAWGKRSLSYLINKEKEGYYMLYDVLMPAAVAEPMKKMLNINGDVLRYLLKKTDSFAESQSVAKPAKK